MNVGADLWPTLPDYFGNGDSPLMAPPNQTGGEDAKLENVLIAEQRV